MSFAGRFINERTGLCDPVMLQVPPVSTYRIPTNGANVVMDAELGTGETFQNDAEPSRGDVKAAGLEPDAVRVGNPRPIIIQVGVRDKVLAASSIGIEPVGCTVEGVNRHVSPCFELATEIHFCSKRPVPGLPTHPASPARSNRWLGIMSRYVLMLVNCRRRAV